MKQAAKAILIRIGKTIVYGLVGALVMGLAVGIHILNDKPDLEIWHTRKLKSEFDRKSQVDSFAQYLELEGLLFQELDEKIYGQTDPEDHQLINRYHRDSLADPGRWPVNWNRSFEWKAEGEPVV